MERGEARADLGTGRRLFLGFALPESREGGRDHGAAAVMKIMKETLINDMFAKNGKIRGGRPHGA